MHGYSFYNLNQAKPDINWIFRKKKPGVLGNQYLHKNPPLVAQSIQVIFYSMNHQYLILLLQPWRSNLVPNDWATNAQESNQEPVVCIWWPIHNGPRYAVHDTVARSLKPTDGFDRSFL